MLKQILRVSFQQYTVENQGRAVRQVLTALVIRV